MSKETDIATGTDLEQAVQQGWFDHADTRYAVIDIGKGNTVLDPKLLMNKKIRRAQISVIEPHILLPGFVTFLPTVRFEDWDKYAGVLVWVKVGPDAVFGVPTAGNSIPSDVPIYLKVSTPHNIELNGNIDGQINEEYGLNQNARLKEKIKQLKAKLKVADPSYTEEASDGGQ